MSQEDACLVILCKDVRYKAKLAFKTFASLERPLIRFIPERGSFEGRPTGQGHQKGELKLFEHIQNDKNASMQTILRLLVCP